MGIFQALATSQQSAFRTGGGSAHSHTAHVGVSVATASQQSLHLKQDLRHPTSSSSATAQVGEESAAETLSPAEDAEAGAWSGRAPPWPEDGSNPPALPGSVGMMAGRDSQGAARRDRRKGGQRQHSSKAEAAGTGGGQNGGPRACRCSVGTT